MAGKPENRRPTAPQRRVVPPTFAGRCNPSQGRESVAKTFIRSFVGAKLPYKHHANGEYSMAIRTKGDYIFFRGQTGFDIEGNFVGRGDPGAQAEQACKNIKQLAEEAGGSIKDVCKLTVYVTDRSYRPAVYAAIDKYFEGVKHCSTGIVCSGLALPELLVEIDAFAVIDR
jgi:enamine deaminase RidA (YjgF/YER057c/UK114 family)